MACTIGGKTSLVFFAVVLRRVLLCSPVWPGTHNPPVSDSAVLGFQAPHTAGKAFWNNLIVYVVRFLDCQINNLQHSEAKTPLLQDRPVSSPITLKALVPSVN
jgi:hypothetical protein